MDDRDFFSHVYQIWSKTTGANDRFWQPEEYTDGSGRWNIYAVSEDQTRKLVASSVSDKDSDFITAVHGCFADLIRRLTDAVDESDRLDEEKDGAVIRIAELEMEVDDLHAVIERKEELVSEVEAKLRDERGFSAYQGCDITDLRAELELANDSIKDRDKEIAALLMKIPDDQL